MALDLSASVEQEIADKPIVAPIVSPEPEISARTSDAIHIDGNSAEGDVVEFLHHDETEGKFHIEQLQDVEPVLEDAKRRHNAGFHGSSEWKHAGRFPLVIVHAWLNHRGLTMRDFKGSVVNEFLNDSNHSAFRIWQGRV